MSAITQLWFTLRDIVPGTAVSVGLSADWGLGVVLAMGVMLVGFQFARTSVGKITGRSGQAQVGFSLLRWNSMVPWLRPVLTRPYLLTGLRLLTALVFVLVIYAGLFGTPMASRNLATTLTWTWWWTAMVLAVLFVGSAWCALCPWDALATWLVRRRLWLRGDAGQLRGVRVPRVLRNIWPALVMLIVLSWLELGLGVMLSPYATAILALLMVALAAVSLVVFEKKAFCRYFCAIGRTLGVYGQLAPIALRPVDTQICRRCETLACYHGTADIEPCPTQLVMGRLRENTYCISCGACALDCTYQNVAWQLRPLAYEALHEVRPSLDQAGFILGLVALTSFHGLTMLPGWAQTQRVLARMLGDGGQVLWSFTLGMAGALIMLVTLFAAVVGLTVYLLGRECGAGHEPIAYRRLFAVLVLALLPLAFSYQLAHNLTHLVRVAGGVGTVLFNPLGTGTVAPNAVQPLPPLLGPGILDGVQAGLLLVGFWLALRLLCQRTRLLIGATTRLHGWQLWPMQALILAVSLFNLWLLMQPMILRA